MTPTPAFEQEHQPRLWTTHEVARFLGCSSRQIPRLRKEGLPSVRVGGLVRFVPSSVMAWLSECGTRVTGNGPDDSRRRQLTDVAATGDDDNSQCAAADLAREFPGSAP